MADYQFTSIAKHIHSHLEFTFPLPLSYSLFLLVALKNNKKDNHSVYISGFFWTNTMAKLQTGQQPVGAHSP